MMPYTLQDMTQLGDMEEWQFRRYMEALKQVVPWMNHRNKTYDYRGAWKAGRAPLIPGAGEPAPHWDSPWKKGMSPEKYLVGKSGRIYNSEYEDPTGIEEYKYLIDEMNR